MLSQETVARMAENVARIREEINQAAREAGRYPDDILLCAACKTRTVEEVRASADLPIDVFGENHVQELVEKYDAGAYGDKLAHFIGHLQTNKVNKVVGRAALIQSVDSVRLLDKIDHAAEAAGIKQEILVEVNIGGEASKSGVVGEKELWNLLDQATARAHVELRGLMSIPPVDATESQTRSFFSDMRELLNHAREQYGVGLTILSMGMSGDFIDAIKEGATIVRIGTAIYGPRDYSK